MRSSKVATGVPTSALPTARWKPLEIAFWLVPVAAYFLFPRYLTLGSQIFIAGLFALSLDLILGYARIISLGHAAFFGIGAYTAGLLARHGWGEPLSGLAAAAAAAGVVGLLTSFLVVRGQDLTRLMVTLGIGLMLYEAANRASSITGGVDGLSGVEMNKLFGVFAFGLSGKTAYWYCLAVLFIVFSFARILVRSPFGLSLRGIREGERRMPAIGVSVQRKLIAIYTIGAGIAGIAGAVRPDDRVPRAGFERKADIGIRLECAERPAQSLGSQRVRHMRFPINRRRSPSAPPISPPRANKTRSTSNNPSQNCQYTALRLER